MATPTPLRYEVLSNKVGAVLGLLVDGIRTYPASMAGAHAIGILRLASNVADGQTVTIGSNVYEFDNNSSYTAGRIQIVFSTATPTAAMPLLVAAINANEVDFVAIQISVNELLLITDTPRVDETDLAETLAGSNNAWDTAKMRGGVAPGVRSMMAQARVPNAQEIALDHMHFYFPFLPSVVLVGVKTTATDAVVAWDGKWVISADPEGLVTVDNSGSTDWSANETVTIVAFE